MKTVECNNKSHYWYDLYDDLSNYAGEAIKHDGKWAYAPQECSEAITSENLLCIVYILEKLNENHI